MQVHSVGRLSTTTILFAAVAAFGCGPLARRSPDPTAQPGSVGDPNAGGPNADDASDPNAGDPNAGGSNGGNPNGGNPNGGDPNGGDPNGGDPNGGDPNADDAGDPNSCTPEVPDTPVVSYEGCPDAEPAPDTPSDSNVLPTAGNDSTTCGAPTAAQAALDSDGDGFSDEMESAGLAALGLPTSSGDFNPSHKDIFVYVDYYTTPPTAAVQAVVAAFANAPVWNPDGTHGIALHVIWGSQPIPTCQQVQDLNFGTDGSDWTQFNTMKAQNFTLPWEPVAHYAIFANVMLSGSRSGIASEIPGHDFVVTLGDPNVWKGGTVLQQAGTFMHELGHDLGLRHGGFDDDEHKPNYLSVMSYNYQTTGLRWNGQLGVLDYSRLQIGPIDESNLHEDTGMSAVAPTTSYDLAPYGVSFGYVEGCDPIPVMGLLAGPLDFNNNGVYDPNPVSQILDGDETLKTLQTPTMTGMPAIPATQNDWCNLKYQGGVDNDDVIGDLPPMSTAMSRVIEPQDMPPELDHP